MIRSSLQLEHYCESVAANDEKPTATNDWHGIVACGLLLFLLTDSCPITSPKFCSHVQLYFLGLIWIYYLLGPKLSGRAYMWHTVVSMSVLVTSTSKRISYSKVQKDLFVGLGEPLQCRSNSVEGTLYIHMCCSILLPLAAMKIVEVCLAKKSWENQSITMFLSILWHWNPNLCERGLKISETKAGKIK